MSQKPLHSVELRVGHHRARRRPPEPVTARPRTVMLKNSRTARDNVEDNTVRHAPLKPDSRCEPHRPSLTLWLAVVLVTTVGFQYPDEAEAKRQRRPKIEVPDGTLVSLLHLVDADTAWLRLPNGVEFMARFAGINAPECHKRQVRLRGGRRSARCSRDDEPWAMAGYQQALKFLKAGKVRITCERDRRGRCKTGGYGRLLVFIEASGVDLGEALLGRGMAWTFTKYPSIRRRRYCAAEMRARRERIGMWRDGVAIVMARVRPKTRAWYRKHDAACAAAGIR